MEQVQEVKAGGVVARVRAVRDFFETVQVEMKKVAWPSRPELLKATRMIVILSVVLGVAIGLLDWLLQLILVRGLATLTQ
jgi:preprotein translocase SecE subunit